MILDIWNIFDFQNIYRQVLSDIESVPPIDLVELYISDQCSLNCLHCFHSDTLSVDASLTTNEWEAVVNQFLLLGASHFHISGREPFAEKNAFEILEVLNQIKKRKRIKYGVITNGIFPKSYFEDLKFYNFDYLEFSLDGLNKKHDFLRGKGCFQKTSWSLKKALRVFGENCVSTSTTLHAKNIEDLIRFINTMSGFGNLRFFFQPIQPIGNAIYTPNMMLQPHDYQSAIINTKKLLMESQNRNKLLNIFFFIPSYMIKPVCKGIFFLEKAFESFLLNGKSIFELNGNKIKFVFELINVPYWRNFIVTNDGYIIDHCKTRSTKEYVKKSIGSIRNGDIQGIIKKGRTIAKKFIESDCY